MNHPDGWVVSDSILLSFDVDLVQRGETLVPVKPWEEGCQTRVEKRRAEFGKEVQDLVKVLLQEDESAFDSQLLLN